MLMAEHFQSAVLCDVGGTNVSAALFDGEKLSKPLAWRTSDFTSGHELVARLLKEYCTGKLAFAIAGPVAAGFGKLTNGTLELSSTEILKIDGVTDCFVVNDIVAAAISELHAEQRSDASTLRHFDTLVLNVGTGFGGALMSRTGHGVMGIEPGRLSSSHFAKIINDSGLNDQDFFEYESLVSGKGILQAFSSIAEKEGFSENPSDASEIFLMSKNGVVLAEKTISLFRKGLAIACAELSLFFPDINEIMLTGSVVTKNREKILQRGFSEVCLQRLALAGRDRSPSVTVISHQKPELIGLAKLFK